MLESLLWDCCAEHTKKGVCACSDLTSQPAKEVVVVLCRQIGENILDPPPKLGNQDRDGDFIKKKTKKKQLHVLENTLLVKPLVFTW